MRITASLLATFLLALFIAGPAPASTKEGVEKWKQGAYKEAVMAWLPPAARGDANALFNLGLASRQGRGLPKDLEKAEDFFRRAAEKGHNPARTYLGIFLARKGQDEEAIRLWRQAQRAGEPYAHYMLGIKMFNGEGVKKDWPRAYAYMLVARNSGLAQAERAIVKMDANMPPAVREQGRKLADDMMAGRSDGGGAEPKASNAERAVAETGGDTPPAPPTTRGDSVLANREAVPIDAETNSTASVRRASGYRVQLGAYGREPLAREAWAAIRAANPEILRDMQPVFLQFDGGIRLQIGEFADRSEARALCGRLEAAGRACFVAPIV